MKRRRGRLALQLGGFAIGLGLLGWCIKLALSEENREQIARLGEASPGPVLALIALSAATIALNGLIFWVTIRPERRVPLGDTIAVSALATFLNYLPFKLSVLSRILIHNQRHGVPVLTIGAWFAAVLVGVAAAIGPLSLASLWRREVDALWWAASLGGVAAAGIVVVAAASVFAGKRGIERMHRMLDPMALAVLHRAVRSNRFAQLHTVFAMLASARSSDGRKASRSPSRARIRFTASTLVSPRSSST